MSWSASTRRPRAATARGGDPSSAACPPGPTRWSSGTCPTACAPRWGPTRWPPRRHMHEFGTTSEQLAAIAVSTREWAALNPRARYRDPLTVADVLASPLQVSPLHLLDCCLVTDGAGAFVMTSAARARSLRRPPVYVLGAATCTDHMVISQMPDLTTTPGVVSGARAFAMAGLSRRRPCPHGLRQLHDHGAAAPGGPRLLREGRGWPLRRARARSAPAADPSP